MSLASDQTTGGSPNRTESGDTLGSARLKIAIIGSGIIGVMTALGLLQRGFDVKIYEQGASFQEVSAGFAFTGVARECMERLSPCILEALKRVGEENKHPQNRYWDGFSNKQTARDQDSLLFQLSARDLAYWGCLRSSLLRELAADLPPGVTEFNKKLVSYIDNDSKEAALLSFEDGTIALADAVIGCDGIHSRTRQLVLGEDDSASYASYSHHTAYRAVLPIDKAIAAIGSDKAMNQCIHMGPDAAIVSYPVSNWTLWNVAIFVHDPEEWPNPNLTTVNGSRTEVETALREWSADIQQIAKQLPESVTKWAIFDMADHPARTYACGRVCVAGDAAHASSPFQGAGACMGVEDALVVATTLEAASKRAEQRPTLGMASATTAAFEAYSRVRIERSQWLVKSSRETGDMYQWRLPTTKNDAKKCHAEMQQRTRMIWDFDVQRMVNDAEAVLEEELSRR
ncbi:salicylate 1-monooxygenase SalA [Seiridium cupressi]